MPQNQQSRNHGPRRRRKAQTALPPVQRLKQELRQYEGQLAAESCVDFFEAMLDPRAHEAQRIQDAITASTAIFEAPLVYNIGGAFHWDYDSGTHDAKSQENLSTVVVFPGPRRSVWSTYGSQATIDAPMLIYEPASFDYPHPTDEGSGGEGYVRCPMYIKTDLSTAEDSYYGSIPRLGYANGPSGPIYECGFDCGSTGMFIRAYLVDENGLAIHDPLPNPMQGSLYNSTTSTWIPVTLNYALDASGNPCYESAGGTFAGGVLGAWCLRSTQYSGSFPKPPNKHINYQVHIGSSGTRGPSTFPNSPTLYSIKDIPSQTTIAGATKARVTACSLLATYMGSDLQNGGQLAIARLPPETSIVQAPKGDVYSFVAGLSEGNYVGRTERGGYAWWRPSSNQELFFQDYGESAASQCRTTTLVTEFFRSDPTQDMKIEVFQHLEVHTTSLQFAKAIAPYNPSFDILMAALAEFPAATENETHRRILRSLWSRVVSAVKNPTNWAKLIRWGFKALAPGAVKALAG